MKHYEVGNRDIMEQDSTDGAYFRHVQAMTAEGLHSKSDIAAELAHRDIRIAKLEAEVEMHKAALRDIASYEGADSSLDINAANMRATAREALGLESETQSIPAISMTVNNDITVTTPVETSAEATLICPMCGVDRYKRECPNGSALCPVHGESLALNRKV